MTYVLLDSQFISASEQQDLLGRCLHTGRLVSGLIRSTDERI